MKNKLAAIDRLLNEGWFETRQEAQAWVMTGRVLVNDRPILSLQEKIPESGVIRVKAYYKKQYVNKGGLKLQGALESFGLTEFIKDRPALDCGASTGGFTDCLLQHGASVVYAVDAGHDQLAGKLLIDQRVKNLERTNLADPSLTNLSPRPEIITLDLSYLSLKKALDYCRDILGSRGLLVCLVKPIFEVDSSDIRRSGDINQPSILKDILLDLCSFFCAREVNILGLTHSPVTGNSGTLEFFLGLHWNMELTNINLNYEEAAEKAVANAFDISKFKK